MGHWLVRGSYQLNQGESQYNTRLMVLIKSLRSKVQRLRPLGLQNSDIDFAYLAPNLKPTLWNTTQKDKLITKLTPKRCREESRKGHGYRHGPARTLITQDCLRSATTARQPPCITLPLPPRPGRSIGTIYPDHLLTTATRRTVEEEDSGPEVSARKRP
ncbi:hypothetical protein J6590_028083 [Homalodisca vitripennis]|nr:hypothetical protein J6590_028083 [Homalodisca vitripennis]